MCLLIKYVYLFDNSGRNKDRNGTVTTLTGPPGLVSGSGGSGFRSGSGSGGGSGSGSGANRGAGGGLSELTPMLPHKSYGTNTGSRSSAGSGSSGTGTGTTSNSKAGTGTGAKTDGQRNGTGVIGTLQV
jgi:hypothetical protein